MHYFQDFAWERCTISKVAIKKKDKQDKINKTRKDRRETMVVDSYNDVLDMGNSVWQSREQYTSTSNDGYMSNLEQPPDLYTLSDR